MAGQVRPLRKRERREEISADQETQLERMMGLEEGVPLPDSVRAAYFAVKRSMDRLSAGNLESPMLAVVIAMGTMKEWFPRAEEPTPPPYSKPVVEASAVG